MTLQELKPAVTEIIQQTELSVDNRLLAICALLEKEISYYNWVGFYFKNGDTNELKLGPYVGEPTSHTIIPFG